MHKYLFITYGESGWRGVQIRALRIASYLPKNEVLFWNLFDSKIIEGLGFKVETKDSSLTNLTQLEIPKGTETVIFADIPTNEIFEYAVYLKALEKNLKIVICDQIYKKNQMKEPIFKKLAQGSDLFLLNSLSVFKSEENGNIKIIPPQIEIKLNDSIKKEIRQRFEIPDSSFVLFGSGYEPKVFEKIKRIAEKLDKKGLNFYILASSEIKKVKREGRIIKVPFQSGDDYFKFLYAADAIMVKFGFLQALEALSLGKPTIVLGEAGQLLQNLENVDEIYKSGLRFDFNITEETLKFIEKLISDPKFRKKEEDKVKKLHNGNLFGGKIAANMIKNLKKNKQNRKEEKKLAVLVNNEIFEKEDFLKKEENVYPLCLIIPMPADMMVKKRIPKDLLDRKIRELEIDRGSDILPHSFKELYVFSHRKVDGLLDIFPWYQTWIKRIEFLMDEADKIYMTEKGKKFFSNLIVRKRLQDKISLI